MTFRSYNTADERSHDALQQYERDALWADYGPCIKAQAREELIAECRQSGSVARAELLYFCAEYGVTSAKAFIENSERLNTALWSDRIESIYQSFCESDPEAAA